VRKLLTLFALHAQPACVVTLIVPLTPAAGALTLVGLIAYVQAWAGAACETVKAWPATVPVKVLAVVLVFAVTANVRDPDPVRPVPFWNVRALLLLLALHGQPVCVVTVMVPLAAASNTLIVVGLTAYVQAAAACDTVKLWPATVPVTVRAVVLVFAATVNVTDPDPVRPLPFWNVRAPLALVALHAHPACVVTVTVPLVPAAGALTLVGLIE
jgi:hypothetical protein